MVLNFLLQILQVIGFISAVLGKTGTKLDIYGKFLSENDKNKVCIIAVLNVIEI